MRFTVLLALWALLSGCLFEEEWTAFVYPDANNLLVHSEAGPFASFAECQAAAIGTLRGKGLASVGDYECGLNCKYDPEWQASTCEETRK